MKTPSRDELLEALAALGREYPNWRLGQLVANIAGWADHEVWDVEDEQLLGAARRHVAARAHRGAGESSVTTPSS